MSKNQSNRLERLTQYIINNKNRFPEFYYYKKDEINIELVKFLVINANKFKSILSNNTFKDNNKVLSIVRDFKNVIKYILVVYMNTKPEDANAWLASDKYKNDLQLWSMFPNLCKERRNW